MGIFNAFNCFGRADSYSDDTSISTRDSFDALRRRHKIKRTSARRGGPSSWTRWRNLRQRRDPRPFYIKGDANMPYWARQISDTSVDRLNFEMSGGRGTDRLSPDGRNAKYTSNHYSRDGRWQKARHSTQSDWFVYDRQSKAPREARYREYRPFEGHRDDPRDRKDGRRKKRAWTAYCSDDLPPQAHRDNTRTADRHRSTLKNRHTYSRHDPYATLRSKPANDGRHRKVHREDPWQARREHNCRCRVDTGHDGESILIRVCVYRAEA